MMRWDGMGWMGSDFNEGKRRGEEMNIFEQKM